MKKFISLIALVGVFAACQPENLRTAYNVLPATAIITTTVESMAPGFSVAETTISYTWSNGFTESGKGLTTSKLEATDENPAIEKGTVTVTATFNGSTKTETIAFPTIYAGLDANLNVAIFLPYNVGGYSLEVEKGTPASTIEVYGLKASKTHGYPTAQQFTWEGQQFNVWMMENATPYILEDSYSWTSYSGYEMSEVTVNPTLSEFSAEVAVAVREWVADQEDAPIIVETPESKEFAVGAWSLYNVLNPVKTTVTPCSVVATPLLGSNNPTIPDAAAFTITKKDAVCGVVEFAHPDHASHYVSHSGDYYHGHALHGDNNNAGGGIIDAE